MTPDPRAAKYLEESGGYCPACETPVSNADGRLIRRVDKRIADGFAPHVEVEWKCRDCPARWVERYDLAAVSWVESRNVVVGAARDGRGEATR